MGHSAFRLLLATVTAAATVSGCALVNKLQHGVSHPMTPQEAKAQTIVGARDVVKTLRLKDVGATFRYEACRDDGKPPYRGLVQIDYAHAPTYEGSRAEVAAFVDELRRAGWSSDSGYRTHATSLAKNNIVTVLSPYGPNGSGGIEVLGECRDVTDHLGQPDTINTPVPPNALS
jgi:hypothetical protein